MKRIAALLLIAIVLLSTAVSCGNGYAINEGNIIPPEYEMDKKLYSEHSEAGKQLYEQKKLTFDEPYFEEFLSAVEDPVTSIDHAASLTDREEFCTYYSYIKDYFETFEEITADYSEVEKEDYTDRFLGILRKKWYDEIKRKNSQGLNNNELFCMCIYTINYLEKNYEDYCAYRTVFAREYGEVWTFSHGDPEVDAKLEEARRLFKTSSGKEALKYLSEAFPEYNIEI